MGEERLQGLEQRGGGGVPVVEQRAQDGAAVGGANLGRYASQEGFESGEGRGTRIEARWCGPRPGRNASASAPFNAVYEGTYRTQHVQHASLETHGAVAWFDEDNRLNVRTSSQTPFLTRRALCALYDLPLEQVRVVVGRVGGGFGGKQEMLVEDIVALAVLRLRRPVKLEYTRAEQFYGATTRHPFTIR